MRKIYFLLVCFFCIATHAQITDLTKLSKGKFYSSDIIKDDNNNIKGYFLLFESDKVAKETVKLEYVVLDENLTKVTSGFMTEMKYASWIGDAEKISVRTSLENNKLLLELHDQAATNMLFKRYRVLDIKSNEMSNAFMFNKDSLLLNPVFNRKNTDWKNNESEGIYFFSGIGMIVSSQNLDPRNGRFKKYFEHYDNDFKKVWRFEYSDAREKRVNLAYCLTSDKKVIVLNERYNKPDGKYFTEGSLLFLNAQTGTLIKEFAYPDTGKYNYRVIKSFIKENRIYVLGSYAIYNDDAMVMDKNNIGLFRFVFDKSTGEMVTSSYLKWDSLKDKLDIDKNGLVKNEGFLFAHNMLPKENGNIVVVAEAFIGSPVTTKNIYFFEFDDQFVIKDQFTVEKFKSKVPKFGTSTSLMQSYGLFDFIDYQNLGDDEFLFFFNDNEKDSDKKKKSTKYGVVSYSDGVFKRQTLDMKTETSTITPYNAKKGYLMLVEEFKEKNKPTEYRLEKINY